MIVLFTDFGPTGPYLGQMRAALVNAAPELPVVDLLCDAPRWNPQPAAFLLAACATAFLPATVFLCVVDPGVGGPRRPLLVEADGRWFVGPDNGLLHAVCAHAEVVRCWEILWRPARLSASFHGRDLFAPVAAAIATGAMPACRELDPRAACRSSWPQDLARVIYVDHFGNAMTGLRMAAYPETKVLTINGHHLARASTFGDCSPGTGMWYENANGLIEIAVNQGRADRAFGIAVGSVVAIA